MRHVPGREDFRERYPSCQQMALKARRCYPGVVGEVLAAELESLPFLGFLGVGSLPARLYREIEALDGGLVVSRCAR